MKLRGKSFLLVRFDQDDGNKVAASYSDKNGLQVRFSRSLQVGLLQKRKAKKGIKHVARG